MAEDAERTVSLNTLHQDLGELKALIATGLKTFPPEWPGEVLRLLREMNRLSEERFARLDATIREQTLETHGILRALAESQRQIVESQRQLVEEVRQVWVVQRQLSEDMRAIIARIDALIKSREGGSPPASPGPQPPRP